MGRRVAERLFLWYVTGQVVCAWCLHKQLIIVHATGITPPALPLRSCYAPAAYMPYAMC